MPLLLVKFVPQSISVERVTLIQYLVDNDTDFNLLDGLTDEQLIARINANFDALQAVNEVYIIAVDAAEISLKPQE